MRDHVSAIQYKTSGGPALPEVFSILIHVFQQVVKKYLLISNFTYLKK